MVCWLGAMPRPRRLLPPLEGGGGQPCNGLLVVLPPVRKSPVSRACGACCRARTHAGRIARHGGGAGRAQMHGADAPAHCADVCHVRDRPTERRARCLCAPASLLCVGCCCDVAVRCDACRCAWCCAPSAGTVTARLLASDARQRDASRGAQSAE